MTLFFLSDPYFLVYGQNRTFTCSNSTTEKQKNFLESAKYIQLIEQQHFPYPGKY